MDPAQSSGSSEGAVLPKMTSVPDHVSRVRKELSVHTCDVCKPPRTFTRAEHLRRHKQSHKLPGFPCTFPGCGSAFHKAELLALHTQRHESESTDAANRNPDSARLASYPSMAAMAQSAPMAMAHRTPMAPMACHPLIASYRSSMGASPFGLTPMSSIPTEYPSLLTPQFSYPPSQILPRNAVPTFSAPTKDPSLVPPQFSTYPPSLITPKSAVPQSLLKLKNRLPPPVSESSSASLSARSKPPSRSSSGFDGPIGLPTRVQQKGDELQFLLDPGFHEVDIRRFSIDLAVLLTLNIPALQLLDIVDVFPDLLERFSIRLGQEFVSERHKQVAYLIFSHIQLVAGIMTSTVKHKSSVEPFADKTNPGQSKEALPTRQEDLYTILQTSAYKSLYVSVLNMVKLKAPGTEDAQTRIRQRILEILDRQSSSDFTQRGWRQAYTKFTIVFQAPWISKFFETQYYEYYGASTQVALENVVVLTGTSHQAWATTCLEYVQSVWPESGIQVLNLHKDLFRYPGQACNCTLFDEFDQTQLVGKISPDETSYTVSITGTARSIADVIEQLVWLNTSLSSMTLNKGILCQFPSCEVYAQPPSPADAVRICWPTCAALEVVQSPVSTASAGDCWTNMFNNPVLVKGYPIPRRLDRDSGLEIPLSLMTNLVNAKKISMFSGHILIKGYSTILVPTKQHENFVFWHMIFNEDGSHISYADSRVKALLEEYPRNLSIGDLETARHILGWCANVKNCTGARDANYEIGWSRLKQPGPGCAFEKITIVGGMFVTGGISATIGKKDKAVHIKFRDDYTMRLKWIAKKFVVLYDVQERRAWLVDGASALLHLVRASLKHDSSDAFRSLFIYKDSALREASQPYTGKAASISVLTDWQNINLPLYAKPDSSREEVSINETGMRASILSSTKTNYCLKDRIENICDVLEQIMAHQADTSTQDGVGFKIRCSARRQLEGFDFMDVAADEDPLWPRVATLRASGKGWVDFTRTLHAITLFGTGFGDLIQPAKGKAIECTRCGANVEVPKGQDYLAVCVSEIQDILQKRGSENTSPWRLVDDIYWHAPDKTFEPCHCTEDNTPKHDRVQVLLPATFPKLWGRGFKSPSNLALTPKGAFLFGHSWRFPLKWNDQGVPEEGQPENHELEEMETSFHDSSIGTNLGASSANTASGDSSDSPDLNRPTRRRTRPWEIPPVGDLLRGKRMKLSNIASSSSNNSAIGKADVAVPEESCELSHTNFLTPFAHTSGKIKTKSPA
ncbi:hypothetical protein F4819DRAFT_477925 [Hypoxylon fuscum]|nr:hypothetical protein F4819DRAFT_477925 [Hypoxylon fuscum]